MGLPGPHDDRQSNLTNADKLEGKPLLITGERRRWDFFNGFLREVVPPNRNVAKIPNWRSCLP
jgi:hypothetical protein